MSLEELKLSFLQNLISHKGAKTQRKMRSIFLLSALVPLWLTSFGSEAAKAFLLKTF